MARYIDADKLIAHLKDEIKECEIPFGSRANSKGIVYGTALGLKSAISFAETLSTADVAPKSEADNWYQLYHSIKEELKQEKMYHRETDKLCDRYYIESQQAKRQVAREIFEEIEKAHDECIGVDITTRIGYFQQTKFEHKLAELKKKYTEDVKDDTSVEASEEAF